MRASCVVTDCDRSRFGHGYCQMHYARLRKHGDVAARLRVTPRPTEDRFWEKVDGSGDCWEWTGTRQTMGYGSFWVLGQGKRLAHRVAYELLVGPIAEGRELDHRCRNRICVNPDHLEPVSHRENVRRGVAGRYQMKAT